MKRKAPSGTSSSTTSFTPSLDDSSVADDVADPSELEAAEALADLAELAMGERLIAESTWGGKRKRVLKRVKSESPPHDSVLNGVDSGPSSLDRAEEQAKEEKRRFQEFHGNFIKSVKVEQDTEFVKPLSSCVPKGRPSGIGKSKLCLTEEEKEARRIRRVLANRESARQTIRRRQALCQELTMKAADLTRENEDLKREKEIALKRYQSLEAANKQLKEQVSKAIKNTEAEEDQAELKPSHAKISASAPMGLPFSFNHHPFQQIFWPSIVQTSHSVPSQIDPDHAFLIQTGVHAPLPSDPVPFRETDNYLNNKDPRGPLCVMQWPWFFPSERANVVHAHPFFSSKKNREGITLNNYFSTESSSTSVTDGANFHSCEPPDDPKLASGSSEPVLIGAFYDSFGGLHRHVDGFHVDLSLKECPGSSSPCIAPKHGSPVAEEVTLKSCQSLDIPDKKQEAFVDPSCNKLVTAIATAEARKRRRELTRLKNIHGRQCRINI